MDAKTILIAVALVVGVLLLASPLIKPLVAKVGGWFKRAPVDPLPPAKGDHQAAYNAVLTLIKHFEAVGCAEGEKLAREAGGHLFHEGPHV